MSNYGRNVIADRYQDARRAVRAKEWGRVYALTAEALKWTV